MCRVLIVKLVQEEQYGNTVWVRHRLPLDARRETLVFTVACVKLIKKKKSFRYTDFHNLLQDT